MEGWSMGARFTGLNSVIPVVQSFLGVMSARVGSLEAVERAAEEKRSSNRWWKRSKALSRMYQSGNDRDDDLHRFEIM
jgi:hypothetical protein